MGVRSFKPNDYKISFNKDYRLRFLVNNIKAKRGNFLDVGCGGGIFTEAVACYYPKLSIFGYDVSHSAISYAKKFGSGSIKYAPIKNKKLPYKNSFFNYCICFDVLEHVPDIEFFLKEIKRVTVNKGKVYFIIPCEGQAFTYTWIFNRIKRGEDLTYKYMGYIHPEFTYRYVVDALERSGFKVINKWYSEHWFYQISHLVIYFLPKFVLETVLGKRISEEYTNSNIIAKPNNKNKLLMAIRSIWFYFFDFMMMYPMYLETIIFNKIPFGAWKIHLVVEVRK